MALPSEEDCHVCLCFQPSWGRRLANRNLFTICYSILSVVQSISWVYVVSILTSVEHHFQLPSETFGSILSVGEVVVILSAAITGLCLQTTSHRPRAIAYALIVLGFGCYLFILPYHLYGPPIPLEENGTITNEETSVFCSDQIITFNKTDNGIDNVTDEEKCVVNLMAPTEDRGAVVAIFIVALSISNCAAMALHIIGTPYLDDNVRNKDSPMYLAFMCSMRTLGPMCATFLGTLCLSIYVDVTVDPWFDNHDRRWVGAWWLGFAIQGSLALLCAFVVAQFPRLLPSKTLTPAMEMELQPMNKSYEETSAIQTMKTNLKAVITNFLLWARILSETFTWFGIEGLLIYLPKFLEHQFGMTASQANFSTGMSFIMPTFFGNLLVGLLIHRLRPTARQLAASVVISKSIEVVLLGVQMSIQCDEAVLIGAINGTSASCAEAVCDCSAAAFAPVCGSDLRTYFSACHAGCATQELTNCSCVLGGEGLATAMMCQLDCPSKWAYLVVTGLGVVCLSVEIVAGTLFVLRCVKPHEKTLATGLLFAFVAVFTWIPCPLLFSTLVDSACSVWGTQCGRTGACEVYDLDTFRWIIHALPIGLMVVGVFWDIVFWWKVKDKVVLFHPEIPTTEKY